MPDASVPYPSYAYVIYRISVQGVKTLLGGFSEATGLTELPVSSYLGVESPRKVQGTYKVGDVTLKRGVVNATDLWNWISEARTSKTSAHSEMIVTLRNEAETPVTSWRLTNALPDCYSGPMLSGKQEEAALEELVLSCERIQLVPQKA
jgi:phage tail-like protein